MSEWTNLKGDKLADEAVRLADDPDAHKQVAEASILRAMKLHGWTRERAEAVFLPAA